MSDTNSPARPASAWAAAPMQAGAVPVELPQDEVQVDPPEPTKLYELRVLDGCPKQTLNVGAAGATFSAFRGHPPMDADGNIIGHVDAGMRQRLTKAQVDTIVGWVKSRVVARIGAMHSVFKRGDAALKGQTEVQPLAKYLSLIEIPETVQAQEASRAVAMAG